MKSQFIVVALLCGASPTLASKQQHQQALIVDTAPINVRESQSEYVQKQAAHSYARLLGNIQPNGAIQASPSSENPDYAYHWVRDAATVMSAVPVTNATQPLFWKWAAFETTLQRTQNPSSPHFTLGEPKFNLDGSAYTRDWGRPQNDGPATRVLALVRFAEMYLEQGGSLDQVRKYLYAPELPALSVIKADLEYVARVWDVQGVDLWEEVRGDHYHTQLVQAAALFVGARFANRMKDTSAAKFYTSKAHEVYRSIESNFWSDEKEYIQSSIRVQNGPAAKTSFLDMSVVLAAIYTRHAFSLAPPDWSDNSTMHSFDGPQVLLTALQLASKMKELYTINQNRGDLAPGIGRYTEDVYDGYTTTGLGNPWFLATLGYAELAFSLAQQFCRLGSISHSESANPLMDKALSWILDGGFMGQRLTSPITSGISQHLSCIENPQQFQHLIQNLTYAGEAYIARVRAHVPDHDGEIGSKVGSLSEQFHRDTGFMQGAVELTWSHASFLTMKAARDAALESCSRVCAK
ncbi:Glucoamylase, intracellular sporulation-specific [Chytriomyces hyalinus]|nr:Glucoamylase, intracellular sporulation-specific [Chytriomyces hyalinus]